MLDPDPQRSCGLVDGSALPQYDLGSGHPFARDRQEALSDLVARMGLATPAEFLDVRPASRAQLALAHDPAYIDVVERTSHDAPDAATRADAYAYGLGSSDTPVAPGQHAAASAMTGATLACVEAVASGRRRHAFNPAGGLHHAHTSYASGFCIYNDLVVGIRTAQAMGLQRVLYVDFDVHHGDGVEFAFAADPAVLTLSFHQAPETLFPGTGRVGDRGRGDAVGSVVNMPFAPYTDDDSWWHCVSTLLPVVARRFQPDFILSQHGCDPHREDPLAQLELTTRPLGQAAGLCRDLADELCAGRWAATGGGGYQPHRVIPRAWSMVWLEMSGRPLPEQCDPGWIAAWQHAVDAPLCESFLDPKGARTSLNQQAHDLNLRWLDELLAYES